MLQLTFGHRNGHFELQLDDVAPQSGKANTDHVSDVSVPAPERLPAELLGPPATAEDVEENIFRRSSLPLMF